MAEWFNETLYPAVGQHFRIDKMLYRNQTGRQDLQIFENEFLGRVMTLDGIVQVTERDEYVYHEMLSHVPVMALAARASCDTACKPALSVLIIGGGDGGVLRRCLMHDIERATMVEIDDQVVDLCRTYLPSISDGAFDDPRTNLVIADGARFVDQTTDRFDIIIVDSTDPIGPGKVLFSKQFYRACKKCLNPGGVLVTQNGVPFFSPHLSNTHQSLTGLFADNTFYTAAIPTYYGGFMALGWASDDAGLRRQATSDIDKLFKATNIKSDYYTPEIHAACFALPRFISRHLETPDATGDATSGATR